MCGICGTINTGTEKQLQKMVDLLKHRGPDDKGISYLKSRNNFVYFGNARLSIIDLSQMGHMPMQTEDGRFTITYNGECYNFRKIRDQLIKKGYAFRSSTDTEVILKAYQHWGKEAVDLFDGMYAIAIWDNMEEELMLIRDRAGIKPLYFYHDNAKFAFASEIKSLLVLDDIKRNPNIKSLILMAGFFWSPDPYSAFENIYRLPSGHYLTFKNGTIEMKRYWKPVFQPAYYKTVYEAIEDFDSIFANSV
jgi:asparagine synthase (glutamine-hydrolysing)